MAKNAGGKVWDGPTRLFHWSLVGLFAFSWWTAKHDQMDRHLISGLILLGLLIFRLFWGVIGGNTARFAHFVKAPRHVLTYLRAGKKVPIPGHNPLGAYSVVVLLSLLVIQVVAGLFSVDVDGLESGPLSYLITFDHGRLAAHVHAICFQLLEAMIVLHILAMIYYRLRGRNLVLPMITGRDPHVPQGSAELQKAPWWRFIVAAAIAGALAWWVSKGIPL